jgi:hypothetical protein
LTLKGSTAPRPECDKAEHPKGKGPIMMRLYKRDNRTFKRCAWLCTGCRRVRID